MTPCRPGQPHWRRPHRQMWRREKGRASVKVASRRMRRCSAAHMRAVAAVAAVAHCGGSLVHTRGCDGARPMAVLAGCLGRSADAVRAPALRLRLGCVETLAVGSVLLVGLLRVSRNRGRGGGGGKVPRKA
eukprot:363957-Chlamydomonas_euryale.AAC.2